MDVEQVLHLFESYWFEQQIITKKPSPPPSQAPDPEIQKEITKPVKSRSPSRHVRSLSDQLSSQPSLLSPDFSSPQSVLSTNYKQLQTIPSGKEIQEEVYIKVEKERPSKVTRRKKNKSLSDLEFEELKGFMDLGFVFSEEDKNSELVSIIPGLQRLGRKEEEDEVKREEEEHKHVVARPYLSEAWYVMEQQRKQNPLMNWRIPSVSNEMDMKHHLKYWAHTVASTAIR